MKKEIEQALSRLEGSIERLEALAAWQGLQRSESRPDWPMRLRRDSMAEEFSLEIGRFWLTVGELDPRIAALPPRSQSPIRRRLACLIAQCRTLSDQMAR